jgi:sulfotransferase famil protein
MADAQRLLKNDDTLIFLHIPKTAGSTFSSILASRFKASEIYNNMAAGFLDKGQPTTRATYRAYQLAHEQLNQEALQRYRLLIGHWDFGVVNRYPQLIPLTFLRHPVDQLVSNYRFLRRSREDWNQIYDIMQKMSLKDWAKDADMISRFANWQTIQMAGQKWSPVPQEMSNNQLLDEAKKNLAKCAFIGIQERFDDSLLLLAYTFGWHPVEQYKSLNAAPQRLESTEIDADTHETLLAICQLDLELYEYAKMLYNTRLSLMIYDLFNVEADTSSISRTYLKSIFNNYLRNQIAKKITAKTTT